MSAERTAGRDNGNDGDDDVDEKLSRYSTEIGRPTDGRTDGQACHDSRADPCEEGHAARRVVASLEYRP